MIVNLGLPKSGTTTLTEALSRAGFVCADHLMDGDRNRPVAKLLYDGYFHYGDPLALIDGPEVLGEISILRPNLSLWPQTDFGLLSCLRDRHPDARFVLTRRPAPDIADSMIRWGNLGTSRLPNGAVPGLPAGYGGTRSELVRFIAGHHAMVERVWGDDPGTLILDMGAEDARDRLASFVGRDLPWWGRANVNPA